MLYFPGDNQHIEDLAAGQEVDVLIEDVFDHILKNPDATMEGNKTGELIRAMRNQ